MKFTLSWLKEHLDTKAGVEKIAETLTRIGLEVEELFDPKTALAPFRVAEVVKCEKHPNADKLSVCEVDTGSERLQVVCGAPNARTGMKGVFAPVGSYVPGIDLMLTKAKIRGVESNGMLLSERELELSDEHAGIIELDPKAKVGSPAATALGLDDAVIEVAITPNRPDCLGVRGIARDLAAAGLGKLKKDTIKPVKGSFPNPIPIELDFDKRTAEACPVFAGRLVRGVKNGPSPEWLQRRLKAIGLRPINALVDITNYISYDRGRPLHVYDADKLTGVIRARSGKKGESFVALDGKTYEVDGDMCVIADDRAVLGLGGVIGGEETGATFATTNVFIESAYFDPKRTARTGRRLGVVSDARFRFERGVDPDFVVPGLELATEMVLDLCGGTPSKVIIAGRPPKANKPFKFDPGLVERLSGLELEHRQIKQLLNALGISLDGKGRSLKASPPSWRPDISGPADLVEEIVRLTGVDKVPAAPMTRVAGVAKPLLTEPQRRQRLTRRVLAARGLVEAVTWSFIPPEEAKLFGGGQSELTLSNPISTELAQMRPSLLPGLITAAQRNRDRGFADGALFELGQAYRGALPEDQFTSVAGVRFGRSALIGSGRYWSGEAPAADVFAAKADAVAALAALGIDQASLSVTREAPSWFHPGRSGALKLGPKTLLGAFGEFHPDLLGKIRIDPPLAGFELYLDNVPPSKRKGAGKALEALDLQPVRRDFAFLLGDDIEAGEVLRAALGADRALISEVRVFDVFTGQGVPQGKKSLAIEVTLQPREKTLTDAEIEAVAGKIVAAVQKATGGELRG
ncbi:MAG TPA: phenylalanine--tRNA ligase subunit beta [Methyloceanibacter sp.]|jgi:phenylalanyl-tRNA synthetase beta chain|nr:phenylalanine--tRNA ligase subunit beta [Methyloceanibacter sp.]